MDADCVSFFKLRLHTVGEESAPLVLEMLNGDVFPRGAFPADPILFAVTLPESGEVMRLSAWKETDAPDTPSFSFQLRPWPGLRPWLDELAHTFIQIYLQHHLRFDVDLRPDFPSYFYEDVLAAFPVLARGIQVLVSSQFPRVVVGIEVPEPDSEVVIVRVFVLE